MSSKPLLLDTFCKAGGTSMGYYRAGFEVVGVDIEPQKRYPFEFHQGDAIEFIEKYGKDFDVIAASPPCQDYTPLKAITGKIYPRLIQATRQAMIKTGKPYIIENVSGARKELINPIMLCGTMFGLKLEAGNQLRKHRLFEVAVHVDVNMHCNHNTLQTVNVFGNSGGSSKRDGIKFFNTSDWRKVMDIDWMIGKELAQAIPPAYTEWIGKEIRSLGVC